MDAISTQLPKLTPLENSFTVDDVEAELKQLFIDLFDKNIAADMQDANVLGMAHLGSFDLIRKIVNTEGLVLLNSEENPATRRLYRAWRAGHLQGRGTHFLETYLQLLFPNSWVVDQQMQLTSGTYPNELFPVKTFGDDADKYRTSRLKVQIASQSDNVASVGKIAPILKEVIPARLVPDITVVESSSSTARIASMFTPTQILHSSGVAI